MQGSGSYTSSFSKAVRSGVVAALSIIALSTAIIVNVGGCGTNQGQQESPKVSGRQFESIGIVRTEWSCNAYGTLMVSHSTGTISACAKNECVVLGRTHPSGSNDLSLAEEGGRAYVSNLNTGIVTVCEFACRNDSGDSEFVPSKCWDLAASAQ
jgi:hypothetical protein